MKTADYFRRRFEALEKGAMIRGDKAFREIKGIFDKAFKEIEKELSVWYARLGSLGGASMGTAKKPLTPKELKEFKPSIEEYLKVAQNPKWERVLNKALARVNISRLEAIKLSLNHYIEMAFDLEDKLFLPLLVSVYENTYYRASYEVQKGLSLGAPLEYLPISKIERVALKPWALDGINFSVRIWKDKEKLINTLHTRLTQNLILGKPPHKLISDIAKMFSTSKHNAKRLIITEITYFHTLASRDALIDLEVEEYEFSSVLDSKTSELCGDLDGEVFKLKDLEIGVNAPPMHPNCRSVIVPYYKGIITGERAARGRDGKTYDVPANMSYKDWYATMVTRQK